MLLLVSLGSREGPNCSSCVGNLLVKSKIEREREREREREGGGCLLSNLICRVREYDLCSGMVIQVERCKIRLKPWNCEESS